MKGEELLQYESVQNWLKSVGDSAFSRGKEGLTDNAKRIRLYNLWHYTDKGKLNPDELLKEAQEDIDKAGQRLNNYFKKTINRAVSWNSATTNVAYLRGFYTHNGLFLPKKYRLPKYKVSKVSQRDSKTEIYGYNEENGEIVFRNGTLQQFVQNLNFRDQTIALCLLSTGADANDLFKLNVDFVKDARGKISDVKRFFWHGNRAKNGTEFKVYFSEESTEFLKRYVEQERADAKDNEPLFPKEDRERMETHALSMQFRIASKKMGYVIEGQASPFRPKRFRHLFRTACSNANVDSGYIMAFMGHASNVSASYLEKSNGMFLKEYVKVEPYVTVFGVNKHKVTEMSEEIEGLKGEVGVLAKAGEIVTNRTNELEVKVEQLKSDLSESKATVESWQNIFQENYVPLLKFVKELSEMPEFEDLKKRIYEEKEERLQKEAREG